MNIRDRHKKKNQTVLKRSDFIKKTIFSDESTENQHQKHLR